MGARGWGGVNPPKQKFAQIGKKLKKLDSSSVFSNCSHKVGVGHGHDYWGKG